MLEFEAKQDQRCASGCQWTAAWVCGVVSSAASLALVLLGVRLRAHEWGRALMIGGLTYTVGMMQVLVVVATVGEVVRAVAGALPALCGAVALSGLVLLVGLWNSVVLVPEVLQIRTDKVRGAEL